MTGEMYRFESEMRITQMGCNQSLRPLKWISKRCELAIIEVLAELIDGILTVGSREKRSGQKNVETDHVARRQCE